MELQLTVRHGQVNGSIRGYVEGKFRKLERRLHATTVVDVVLDRERNPKIADDHVVEATVYLKGPTLHGREAATSYEAATDVLVDKLERQIERHRDKRVHEPRRRASAPEQPPVPPELPEQPPVEAQAEEPAA
jgi:putative sigma-54 modulation protein